MSSAADDRYLVANAVPPKNYRKSLSESPGPPYLQPNPHLFCIFCLTTRHSSHECSRYQSSGSFWRQVLEQRRCKNCLRFFHRSNNCYDRSLCYELNCRRKDKHSPVLCFARYNWKNYLCTSRYTDGSHNCSGSLPSKFGSRLRSAEIKDLRFSDSPPQHSTFHRTRRRSKYKGQNSNRFKIRNEAEFQHSDSQICQNECPPVSKISVSCQTETERSQEIPVERFSQGCQTANRSSVNVNVQTDVIIPPFVDVYNDSVDDFMEKLNEVSSQSENAGSSTSCSKSSSFGNETVSSHSDNSTVTIHSGYRLQDKINISNENFVRNTSTANNTERLKIVQNESQLSPGTVDPFDSLSELISKVKKQTIQRFSHFSH